MRTGFLAVIMLVVGLIVGIGIGYLMQLAPQTAVETRTLTQTIQTTVVTTIQSPTTIISLTTFTKTVEAPVKAEWTTGDGVLKISSELVPEKIDEEIVSYTLKVTVTNIGDKPIVKVLIIVFPYTGDKLYEYWNWAQHAATITSLMPGESATHDFLLLPKDMTSYKLTAFAL